MTPQRRAAPQQTLAPGAPVAACDVPRSPCNHTSRAGCRFDNRRWPPHHSRIRQGRIWRVISRRRHFHQVNQSGRSPVSGLSTVGKFRNQSGIRRICGPNLSPVGISKPYCVGGVASPLVVSMPLAVNANDDDAMDAEMLLVPPQPHCSADLRAGGLVSALRSTRRERNRRRRPRRGRLPAPD